MDEDIEQKKSALFDDALENKNYNRLDEILK